MEWEEARARGMRRTRRWKSKERMVEGEKVMKGRRDKRRERKRGESGSEKSGKGGMKMIS